MISEVLQVAHDLLAVLNIRVCMTEVTTRSVSEIWAVVIQFQADSEWFRKRFAPLGRMPCTLDLTPIYSHGITRKKQSLLVNKRHTETMTRTSDRLINVRHSRVRD